MSNSVSVSICIRYFQLQYQGHDAASCTKRFDFITASESCDCIPLASITLHRLQNSYEPIKLSLMVRGGEAGEVTLIFCGFNIEYDTMPSSTRAVMTRCQVTRPAIISMEIRQLVLQTGLVLLSL